MAMSRTMVNQLVSTNVNDIEVFENIFQKYNKYVYNLAYRLSGNADDAKDLTQETFLRVFRSLHTFEKGTSLESGSLYTRTISSPSNEISTSFLNDSFFFCSSRI